MRKIQIAVVGSKTLNLDNEQDKAAWDFAYKVGFALGRTVNVAVITGGKEGITEAVIKGVNDAGGISVNILQGNYKEEGNPATHVNIATTMAGFEYSRPLIYSCDCLIAIGGGTETGIQISLAVDLGIHVVIFSKAGGISSEVFTSLEPTFQKMRSSQLVYLVDDIEEAIDRAKKFATERAKKDIRIEDKISIEIPPLFEILCKKNNLAILLLLKKKKTLSSQEISDELKIPLMVIQSYLQELDNLEIVMAKRTIADEHLFTINQDNDIVRRFINLLVPEHEE
ncbi:MAG TPA: hypothetical protein VMX55_06695 [candidate division Zixibacteria bacterium]|nr:hypothetical protein [candidate division Zixibacteria bacterium]